MLKKILGLKKFFMWETEIKVAVGIIVVFALLSVFELNKVLAFSKVRLEIRQPKEASYILRDGEENMFSASNNPAGCAAEPGKVSYFSNLRLAALISNPRVMTLPESVHSRNENKEYVFEITKFGRTATYFYSPDMLPPELKKIKNELQSPWEDKLKKFGFES
ncbi:TPA: hypothetical protein DDW69_00875 [candidate division CPR2 bacterium]|uniref:Uncharacterized protein n=1 Tax=candidate division CPR2 bacterium GW2011_GWC1_41_48 TaxID=1618344 RepID=A0A0G0Z9C0_UNCC2|nr:MAG: hypothetical protein UT47_C0001G0013 [candidate division CPR2 bacterium GW2011_GWC2_39_35]KKR27837.1 MAG: hypothetical protein UT59_C0042G0001 [candidate division CPR2 bacterium GW2011_GWD1_39_7]KKR28735.1 MAG: hypothetical protein UT60_C0013G0002 [candidate division CPR2 bacterium GW2011_GWD2_39_7]KKS09608.1 MAG: hypothetical protein UU65_C0001G0013 [candidate division CPR2 bacterium GW2011_GWC1_41_48]OGB59962.1 MAG: hypothetical protein A2Y27_00245 [candidate division CPR2 bacterium G